MTVATWARIWLWAARYGSMAALSPLQLRFCHEEHLFGAEVPCIKLAFRAIRLWLIECDTMLHSLSKFLKVIPFAFNKISAQCFFFSSYIFCFHYIKKYILFYINLTSKILNLLEIKRWNFIVYRLKGN